MYYFYRYAPFLIAMLVIGGYGLSMHQMGYNAGIDHGKHLKVMEYIDTHATCRTKTAKEALSFMEFRKKVPDACGKSFTMYSFYYDATIGNCTWNEYTK